MQSDSRDVHPLSAARIAAAAFTLLAVLFLIAAVYNYFVPLHVVSGQGGLFGCGSAADPPKDGFQKGVCMNIAQVGLFKAIGLLVAALATGVLSYLLLGGRGFGVGRTEADDDEDDFDAPRPKPSARRTDHELFGSAGPARRGSSSGSTSSSGSNQPAKRETSDGQQSGGRHADDGNGV